MTKREFLERLRAALGNDLSGSIVQVNVRYYDTYISDEVKKGRSEEDVIAELGDPWVLAQTVIDAADSRNTSGSHSEYSYDSIRKSGGREEKNGRRKRQKSKKKLRK